METTQISINTELYNHAADYARRHNTSIDKMVERYFLTLLLINPHGENPEREDNTEAKKSAREIWKNMDVSEITKKLLPKRRVNISSDDYKEELETLLREKYESLS